MPDYRLTNDFLSTIIDTSDEWIRPRSGIVERRINQQMSNTEMAVNASRIAMERAGISPSQVDLVIGSTVTSDCSTPSMASLAAQQLGINRAIAFDISAGCTGYVYALELADLYIRSGKAKCGLIVCAETLSRIVDYTDRTTCILFGDAAAATVVLPDEETGVLSTVMLGDASGACQLCAPRYDVHTYFDGDRFVSNNPGADKPYITMNGREVFKFAVGAVPLSLEAALADAGLEVGQVDKFIFHQANKRIIDSLTQRYNLPPEKVPCNIERYGNTSSVSVPLLLDELVQSGQIKKGDLLAMSGFGAGLTYGTVILRY